MKTIQSLTIALALILALTGSAIAMHHGKVADMSPEKQAVTEKAHNDFVLATADLKRQIFAKESALNAELYGDKADDEKIEALVAEINALHGKVYSEKVKMQRVMAIGGVLPGMGHGMMMGGDGCPMMGGMKGGHGEKHGKTNDPAPEASASANTQGGHDSHAPAKQ
jgi:zinc resistance-associated protein